MEGTPVIEEHQPSNHKSHDQVSKSARPLIKIDSISIDLANATDAGKCEHFTIRGYAAEMRKKDWKTGWPFPLDGNEKSEESMRLLPPLIVPKSRWWRCHNCMQENCAENVASGSMLNCCSGTGDDTAVLERSQHAAILDVIQEEGALSINPTANVNSNRSQPGEKQTEAANNSTNKGDENGSEVNRAREIVVSAAAAAAGATCRQLLERCRMNQTEVVKTNCNQFAADQAGTEEAVDAFDEHSGVHASLQVDEDTYASPPVRRASFPDKSAAGSRKRNRKMRSIEELLAGKRDANSIDIVIRTELDSVPMAISEASAEVSEPISSQRPPLAIQENLPSKNRKRTTLEMRTSPHMSKKVLRTSGSGAETTVACFGLEERIGAAGVGFQTSSKATEDGIEKGPVGVKKRQKRNNVVHESSSGEPFQESIEKGPVAGKKRQKRNKLVVHESSSDERTQENVSLKPRAQIPLTDKGKGPSPIPREGPSMQYSTMKNGSIAAVPLQRPAVQNAFENQLMQRCRELSGPQFSGGPASLQKGFPQVAQFQRKYADNMNFTPSSYSHFHGELVQRLFSCDLNSKKTANGFPVPNVKTKNASRIEGGRCMDSGRTSNKGTAIEIPESSALSRKLISDHRGESPEIMEIVELMAKNQYERCLPDADSDKQPANSNRRAPLVDLNEEYVGGDSTPLQEADNTQRRESQRNGKTKIGENMGITKEKTIDYLSTWNLFNLEPTNISSVLRPFPQYQETPSRGMHCFPTNQMNAQNSQWMGNVLWHASSQSGLSSTRPEGTPQQNEAFNRNWPSMYPMPFVYNTAQMPANQGNFHGNHNLNFRNPGGSSYDRKIGNADAEALVKTPAGYTLVWKQSGTLFDASGPPPRLFQSPPFPYHTNTATPPTNDNGGGKSHISQRFPTTIPTVGAFPLPFEHGKSLNGATNAANQVPLESRGRGKGKAKAKDSLAQNRGGSSSNPVLAASGARAGLFPVPVHGLQITSPGISNSVLFPQKSHAVGDVNKSASTSAAIQLLRSNVQCTINRNPADFSIPGPENEYMIAGEDLILHTHTTVAPLNRAGTTKLDGRKRRKKNAVPKEPACRQMPRESHQPTNRQHFRLPLVEG